jgi:hypothetical protein
MLRGGGDATNSDSVINAKQLLIRQPHWLRSVSLQHLSRSPKNNIGITQRLGRDPPSEFTVPCLTAFSDGVGQLAEPGDDRGSFRGGHGLGGGLYRIRIIARP